MNKIMISVAPISASATRNNATDIAREVFECYQAGASMVHLHCRDQQGKLTADTEHLEKTVAQIRMRCPIVIEISTGGISNLTIEQRCRPCFLACAECNSLNVGSVNLGEDVYCNPIRDVRFCVEQILQNRKTPEIEVFEIGMLNTTRELASQYPFPKPILISLVLGHIGAMPATPLALKAMTDSMFEYFPKQEDVIWGITQAQRTDWALMETALDWGAQTLRIGFEDSKYLNPGMPAANNVQLVKKLSDIIHARDMKPCSPDDVRAMLRISQ